MGPRNQLAEEKTLLFMPLSDQERHVLFIYLFNVWLSSFLFFFFYSSNRTDSLLEIVTPQKLVVLMAVSKK